MRIGSVRDSRVVKTSGCAASRKHPGILYIHNDNNHGGPIIFAVDQYSARVLGTIVIPDAINHDWEDIAVGPCPAHIDDMCIFIGDIGTDKGHPPANAIYAVKEPASIHEHVIEDIAATAYFNYSEPGSDTLLVDNKGHVYIVGYERGGNSLFYQLPSGVWNTGNREQLTSSVRIGLHTSTEKNPVGGDISPSGNELLIKTKEEIYYWTFVSGDGSNVFHVAPVNVSYIRMPQEEAVCWSYDASGYFTLPEGSHPPLHYYERL